MNRSSDTRILIRTTQLDPRVIAFAETLQDASGHPVTYLLDARHAPVDAEGRSIAAISDDTCRALGLFMPPDYRWRCGDYGYYVARQQFPETSRFWMIEYDVRFVGSGAAPFFAFFAKHPAVDFLATDLRAAGWDWYWARTCQASDVAPHRCLFPVTRLSAAAIDAVRDRRVRQSRRLTRRALWPNDEAMVATTLAGPTGDSNFVSRDINSFGRAFYDTSRFSYLHPIDGDALAPDPGDVAMLHPVLFGSQYTDKLAKLAAARDTETASQRLRRRLLQKWNGLTRW